MYHMFLLSIIRVRPSPTIFASTQPNYLHIYRISCKITKKERRERSLPCYDSHGLIQHVKRIYNNNNNNTRIRAEEVARDEVGLCWRGGGGGNRSAAELRYRTVSRCLHPRGGTLGILYEQLPHLVLVLYVYSREIR
jgi:hypothetical protein